MFSPAVPKLKTAAEQSVAFPPRDGQNQEVFLFLPRGLKTCFQFSPFLNQAGNPPTAGR